MLTCRIISNYRMKVRGIIFGDQGMFIERKLFFEMGMFSEIPLMEDYQFSLDLKKRGEKIGMTPDRIYTSDRRYPRGTVSKLKLIRKRRRNKNTVSCFSYNSIRSCVKRTMFSYPSSVTRSWSSILMPPHCGM